MVQTRSISDCARDQILKPGKCPFRLTGSDARSVVKPGMDFTADRAAMRPQNAVIRQKPGIRLDLVEILGDRQRIPYGGALVAQARHQDRRRQQQDFGPRRGIVGRGDDLVELQPGKLRQQPAAQRPGRIVLAADGQCRFRHMAFPLTPERPARPCRHRFARRSRRKVPTAHASCSFAASDVPVLRGPLAPLWLRYCIAIWAGAVPDEVDDVSGLSEPHGPDRAMAERGRVGAAIPQSRAAGRLRQTVRPARRRPRADLAHVADLYPPGLRHRQGAWWAIRNWR